MAVFQQLQFKGMKSKAVTAPSPQQTDPEPSVQPATWPATEGPAQLPMFLRTRDVINRAHKVDSHHFLYDEERGRRNPETQKPYTPAEQWYHPNSGYGGDSLQEVKLSAAGRRAKAGEPYEEGIRTDKTPPAVIYRSPGGVDLLADGHHRLALHEHLGHEYMPIKWRSQAIFGENRYSWRG